VASFFIYVVLTVITYESPTLKWALGNFLFCVITV